MEPILEFVYKFEEYEEEHIINLQPKSDSLIITIELESKNLYWYKELNSQLLNEITSHMGSYKSLKVFTDMLIQALSKKNNSLSLNFCSLNEIKQLYDPSMEISDINGGKKYLILMYTSFEKVMYPIQMDFLGNNPTKELMKRTIWRLRNKINKLNEENKNLINNNSFNKSNYNLNNQFNENNIPINYNEFQRLKEENENLNNKLKLLEKKNLNDDIYKKYNELSEKYETYKKSMENKMKILVSSLEDLKEKETEKLNQEKEKIKLNKNNNKNISKILELEKKLEISSEQLLTERKQNLRLIEDKNREIDSLKKEIKSYKDSEKTLKVKITNLEKELEREKKGSAYYKNKVGNKTPSRKAKSYHSEGSVSMNESYISSYSKKTTTSYLKKNLIPNSYKNSYQRAKNYSPYGSKKNNRKNSKSKSRSRSGSKKSSGSNSFVAKSIKGPNTVYQRSYKSPYKYEPKKNNVKKNSNSKNKNRISPSKNTNKKENNYIKNQNLDKNHGYNNNQAYNEKLNNNNLKSINNNIINNNEIDKKDNLNDDSNNIADRLSRIQALISQVSGK